MTVRTLRFFLFATVFAALPTQADTILSGALEQGGLVVGQTEPGSKVKLDDKDILVNERGMFVLGFGRNAPASPKLTVTGPDGQKDTRTLTVEPRKWDVQRIDGLPEKKVTPDAKALERIKKENAMIGAARKGITTTLGIEGFESGFIQPVEGRISGIFGSQRILNGQARSPHSALDIAAPTGTPIVATADGTVTLAKLDLYYTGHTVMIDHGHGLYSLYAHMSAIDVEEGQMVRQGEEIGKVGATGRVTGPHLHWGISWKGTYVDPKTVMRILPAETTETTDTP